MTGGNSAAQQSWGLSKVVLAFVKTVWRPTMWHRQVRDHRCVLLGGSFRAVNLTAPSCPIRFTQCATENFAD